MQPPNTNKKVKCEPASFTLSMGEVSFDIRSSLVAQYVLGAAKFSQKAREIEDNFSETTITEEIICEHKAYVVSAFMQSVGALEAEIYEIFTFGQHHHLGSDFYIKENIEFGSGVAKVIKVDKTPTILTAFAPSFHFDD